MDFTKASKKYQEYCRADKHPSESSKKEIHVSSNWRQCNHFKKVQLFYLEELVTREEVGGRLQDSGHGFSQLLVHCSGGAGRVWLSLEYKLFKTHSARTVRIPQYEHKIKLGSCDCEFYFHI